MWKQLFSSSAAFYSSKHETFCVKRGSETSENKNKQKQKKKKKKNNNQKKKNLLKPKIAYQMNEKAAQSFRFMKLSPFELN